MFTYSADRYLLCFWFEAFTNTLLCTFLYMTPKCTCARGSQGSIPRIGIVCTCSALLNNVCAFSKVVVPSSNVWKFLLNHNFVILSDIYPLLISLLSLFLCSTFWIISSDLSSKSILLICSLAVFLSPVKSLNWIFNSKYFIFLFCFLWLNSFSYV